MADANVIVDTDRQFVAESSPTEQSNIVENHDESDHEEGSSPVMKSKRRMCRYRQECNAYTTLPRPPSRLGRGTPLPIPHPSTPFGVLVSVSCLYCLKCTKFGRLILRKIIKIVPARCYILRLKCTKFDFGWGSALSQTPLAGFKGPTSKGRGMGGKGEGR